MKEKILVVGGTGFIGQNLLKNLNLKNYDLYSLSKKKTKKKEKLKKVRYLQCDITKYVELKKKLSSNFDHIINLSGYINHSKKKQNNLCHYIGCKNLVNIFKFKKIKTFIQVGSSLEYGNQISPQIETDICKPKSHYARSKYKASKYIINIGKFSNFPYIILRPYQIFGPKQKKNRLIPQTIDFCLKNLKFKCTTGNQLRDFLYVGDFINLVKKILKSKLRSEIYNVGTGKPIKVKFVIKKIQSIIKSGEPQYGLIKMRKDEIKNLFPSIRKVYKHFNWKPKQNFERAIKKTILSYANAN